MTAVPEKDQSLGDMPESLTYFPSFLDQDEIKSEWLDTFSGARTNVSLASPMLAYMMFRCEYLWTHDPLIETAAAMPWNGKNYVFINPDFWMNKLKNDEQRGFVLLHEILHIFLEHVGRASDEGYNGQLWNIATDYVINLTCAGAYKEENDTSVQYGKKYKLYLDVPKFCLYDERFINMSADEVYHLLLEENDNDAQKAIQSVMGGSDGGGDGEGAGSGQRPLDGVADVPMDEGDKMTNRQSASAGVKQAEVSKSIGENEGNLVRRLEEMNKPFVSWRDELNEIVQHSTKERPTYNRLSRREGDGGVVFPSLTGHKINGVFGFDSSGSMSPDDYADVVGELNGLLDQFEAWDIDLVSCDTQAHVLGTYSSEDDDSIETMRLDAEGGGGTELSSMVHYANEKNEMEGDINFCIIITDGFIPTEPMEMACDHDIAYIVVVTRNGNKNLTLENAKVIIMND